MTDDLAALHAGLGLHRATLEASIGILLAAFTEETGCVVTKIRLDAEGGVACRVELGRDEDTAAESARACCDHEPTRHAKDGCWGQVRTGISEGGGTFERCWCRVTPGTATDI